MLPLRKFTVSIACFAFILLGVAATRPADDPPNKNLKILPKNISHDDLDKVMDGFKAALGVKCNFCHAPYKDSATRHLNFASDEKPEKNTARKMMRIIVFTRSDDDANQLALAYSRTPTLLY